VHIPAPTWKLSLFSNEKISPLLYIILVRWLVWITLHSFFYDYELPTICHFVLSRFILCNPSNLHVITDYKFVTVWILWAGGILDSFSYGLLLQFCFDALLSCTVNK